MGNGRTAQRIAIVLPSLAGGGAERSMLNLLKSFAQKGRTVDLLLFRVKGPYLDKIPDTVRIIDLKPSSGLRGRLLALRGAPSRIGSLLRPVALPFKTHANLRHIESLTRYLQTEEPDVILSALTYTNLVVLWSRRLAGKSIPVVISERNFLSHRVRSEDHQKKWRWRFALPLVRDAYRLADGIITVSDSVADDLADSSKIRRDSIKTIYNPVVDQELLQLADQPLQHPWFAAEAPPVILGAGRLASQKDFTTLIKAFAIVRKTHNSRLLILGEGDQRKQLTSLAQQLGIDSDVELPGFVDNPYKYMRHAAVFALSSRYEGLPGVLIQAMACGCPVISTDCPGGSREILADGEYGNLVPIGNEKALAAAICSVLASRPDQEKLGRRAAIFSVEHAAQQVLEYLDYCVTKMQATH